MKRLLYRADNQIERCNGSSQSKDEDSDYEFYEVCEEDSREETRAPDYKSFLAEFDDYVATKRTSSGVSRALSYGFETGDMVWGKVKSHPWWPGQIFNEAFASPSVRRLKMTGHVLVAFFGDCSYGWFDPAELIPFEPHFSEKSQQTSSSNFAKAVEEARDEAGRRSALGLTCTCRNVSNFRVTNVHGYFAVDVPGYEIQALYSAKQIKKARDGFSSAQTLRFVKRCALAPRECDSDSLELFKKKATVNAFRRAVFEEFDGTYEQAFWGRSSSYASVKTLEILNRAPSRAPLSGSLVIAETLCDTKSSRNDIKESSVQLGQVQAFSQLQGIKRYSAGDRALQSRTPYLQGRMKHELPGLLSMDFTSSSGRIRGKLSSVSELWQGDDMGLPQESKVRMGKKATETGSQSRSSKGSLKHLPQGKCFAGDRIKKLNVLKRSSVEMDSENALSKLKTEKKKKKESGSELNRDCPDKEETLPSEEARAKKSSQLHSAERLSSNVPSVRSFKLEAPELLSNLKALSLDPFFRSSDRNNAIRAVRQFFLRFRSLVYKESLDIPPPTSKISRSSDEPSKAAWRKRLLSDHQQDIPSTKKLKKTPFADKNPNQEEKKRPNLSPLVPTRDQSSLASINAKAQPGKKMAPSTKEIEPTMLVMKFPHGSSLPSTALLKARFSRFGLLDQSAIRVFWKSSICRLVFLHKLDAQTALRYASGNKSLFGNVNVTCFLKACSASECHEPKKAKTDEPIIDPLNQRLEQAHPVHQPNGNGNPGRAQVRFMSGQESRRNNGKYDSSLSSSSSPCVAMESVYKNKQNKVAKSKPVNKNMVDHVEPPLDLSQCTVMDISEEMMKLLLRCNDVVANITGLLGYVPYHSL